MNILILSWRGPGHPDAGGAEISTHEHAKGWVNAGHDVTLFTAYFKGAKKEEIVDGVFVLRKGSQLLSVQWEAFKWYLFKKHIRFDLVIDQFHGLPFFTPLYIRTKKMAFIHEVAKEVWGLNPWIWPLNLIPAVFGRLFEPLIFKLFYKNIPFLTVSESTKRDLVDWGIPEKNIIVIYNGIRVPKIKNFSKEKKKTLIFLGALSKDKGIEDAIRAFSGLNKAAYNFDFWIVGTGHAAYVRYLKSVISKCKIDKKVKFWGFVSEEKKFELLARAQILVCPSIREGWGLVVIEAAFAGTPTVAYDVPGLRDSVRNNETGILTERNVNSLTSNIIELLGNKKKYDKMSHNARLWSQGFSWKKAAALSLGLITKITN